MRVQRRTQNGNTCFHWTSINYTLLKVASNIYDLWPNVGHFNMHCGMTCDGFYNGNFSV